MGPWGSQSAGQMTVGAAVAAASGIETVATVVGTVVAETGELIHPRLERREKVMTELPELPPSYEDAAPFAEGGQTLAYPLDDPGAYYGDAGLAPDPEPEGPAPAPPSPRRARPRLASPTRPAK